MQSTAVRFKFSIALVQDNEYYPAIAHIDSIRWLKDSDLFYHELSKEVRSNISQSSENTHQDPLRDRNTVLNVLGTRYVFHPSACKATERSYSINQHS
jgi:hypothetical protein